MGSEIQQATPSNEVIASYTTETGDQVALTHALIDYYVCPGCTPADAMLYAKTCQQLGAEPFTGDVYLIKYGNKPATVQPSKDYYVKRADSIPEFDGMRHGVTIIDRDGRVIDREGQACYPALGETLIGAWAEVYRRDRSHQTVAKVSLGSYDKGQGLWKTMPDVMIDKVAQATALRQAFPRTFTGLYEAAEMGGTEASAPRPVPVEATVAPAMATVPATPVAPGPAPAPARPSEAEAEELRAISEAIGGDKATVAAAWREGGMGAARALAPKMAEPEQPDADEPLPATGYADADIVF